MHTFTYLLRHFFTHKDFLPPAQELPGTLFTPMHLVFEAAVLAIVIGGAICVSRDRRRIKPVFTVMWVVLILLEIAIVSWDSLAGARHGLDLAVNLSLYPCSIFMYVLPFVIWGHGRWKQAACGYICTLGLLGALINFIYPVARLLDYSCISFPAFHTFTYHGSMLFACLVLLRSGEHRYGGTKTWWEPFLASLPGLIVSIPANIINYSPVQSDYMYFRGQHFLVARVFGAADPRMVTAVLYVLYLVVPAGFYLIPRLWNSILTWPLRRLETYGFSV